MMRMFGDRLKELRNSKHLTQEQLAEILKVNRAALANWETNRAYPDVNIIKKLAIFFDVTIDFLLGKDEDSLLARIGAVLKENKGLLSKEEEEFLLKMFVNYIETVKSQKKK
jgi:transcriptional regulator with XRE-family HTH domain